MAKVHLRRRQLERLRWLLLQLGVDGGYSIVPGGRGCTVLASSRLALAPRRVELAALKATRDPRPDDLVFATTRGNRQTATNVRQRVLGRSIARANEQLGKGGWPPLPDGLTLHSLRRTYASLLFAIGRTAPEVMAQLGHADARLTLRIYAQAMSQEPGERERLQAVVDGGSLGTKRHWSQSADADVPLCDDLRVSESAEFAATSPWSQTGSNRRPPACKAGALPAELSPQTMRRSGGPGRI